MKTYIFPGQGSQAKGMGKELFDDYKDLVEKADTILGYSIKELCLEDPRRELNNTQFTQPALYVVNALSWYKTMDTDKVKPDFLAGHSLGEFNALLAAECFSFEDGLKLVKKRGELMSQAPEGAMAAILNASRADVEKKLAENNLNNIDLANFNTLSQVVISGNKEEIIAAQNIFQYGEVLYYPLNTSGAFHSRFMEPVKVEFQDFLQEFVFSDLKIPVIANVTAEPYQNDKIAENIASQLASSVRWVEGIQYLLSKAEEINTTMDFVELGHGDVLTKLVDRIKIETESIKIDKEKIPDFEEKTDIEGKDDNLNAEQKVNQWNKTYPVGTKVRSLIADYDNLQTRTEAMLLFGHRAAVYMEGFNGYFDLDEVIPL